MLTPWTDDRIAELRRYWEAGYSCSQIASRMGYLTRNAVIGKAHRLGLPSRAGSNVNAIRRKIDPHPPGTPRIQRTVFKSRERKPRSTFINPNAKPGLIAVQSAITGQMISIRGLKRRPLDHEMTKTELRSMFATAAQNTAAMEVLA